MRFSPDFCLIFLSFSQFFYPLLSFFVATFSLCGYLVPPSVRHWYNTRLTTLIYSSLGNSRPGPGSQGTGCAVHTVHVGLIYGLLPDSVRSGWSTWLVQIHFHNMTEHRGPLLYIMHGTSIEPCSSNSPDCRFVTMINFTPSNHESGKNFKSPTFGLDSLEEWHLLASNYKTAKSAISPICGCTPAVPFPSHLFHF